MSDLSDRLAIEALPSAQSVDKDINVPDNDTIYRQAAIDEIEYELEMINSALDSITLDFNARERLRQRRGEAREILNSIQQLPSAQPDLDEWCRDCKEYDQERHSCPRWNRVIRNTVEDLKAEQPERQWIPCSERLPENDVEVLVTDDAGGVQWIGVDKMMSYEDGSGRFWLFSQHPSAWMPLPEPYMGGVDDV